MDPRPDIYGHGYTFSIHRRSLLFLLVSFSYKQFILPCYTAQIMPAEGVVCR
jgi:hypothetical protein